MLKDISQPEKWLKDAILEKNWYRRYDHGGIRKDSPQYKLFKRMGRKRVDIEKCKRFYRKRKIEFRLHKLKCLGLIDYNDTRMWVTPKCIARMTAISLGIDVFALLMLSLFYVYCIEFGFFFRSMEYLNQKYHMDVSKSNFDRGFRQLQKRNIIKKVSLNRYTINKNLEKYNDILEKISETMMRPNRTVRDVKSSVMINE